jgi:hypothetical protein
VNKTRFLKGFHHLCGRAKKSAAKALAESTHQIRGAAPGQLCSLFADAVEPEKIAGAAGSRKRVYTPAVTFWLMLGQVFRGGSLRAAVLELQAFFAASGVDFPDTKGSSGSYSDARKRLEESELGKINERVCAKMPAAGDLLGGRRIMVVDGTGVQIEDTVRNQDWFPQPSEQKHGCGFPVVQLLGLMNLESGALEHFCHSPLNAHEGRLFECELASKLRRGDVLVADRGFSSFLQFAQLAQRGVDALMRLHSSRAWPKEIKGDEGFVRWKRPPLSQCPDDITEEEWEKLPASITVRYVRRIVRRNGFRDQQLIVATTLTQAPVGEILHVYERRWEIELSFDDIKTTMGMDFVAAKSPLSALKMITVHLIAYNLVRLQMLRAGRACGVAVRRISFKGALDAVSAFAAQMHSRTAAKLRLLSGKLLEAIGADLLPLRPFRIEPRVRKRRPKPFPFMTRPRQELRDEIIDSTRA